MSCSSNKKSALKVSSGVDKNIIDLYNNNGWIHISQLSKKKTAICVKSKFGQSYKEIPDDKYQEVKEFIDFLVENPN